MKVFMLKKSKVKYINTHTLTDFQLRVLKETSRIPFGQVRTYKWIAAKIGAPKAYRAVGGALKKNPYPLLVPCHRVIKSNGEIGGFSRGLALKKHLLEFEKIIKSEFCKAKF